MFLAALAAWGGDTVVVGPGTWRPTFRTVPGETTAPVSIPAFHLDAEPVTERDMLAFVRGHPAWRRDRVPRVWADDAYLAHWQRPDDLGPDVDPEQPATHVSWFAARAYCAERGGRLPTEAEWEFAASASATTTDARKNPAFTAALIAWYARPAPARLPTVGGPANVWGVRDLHGLVWEWIDDFDSASIAQESCGGGAVAATDSSDYAAFMRYAFRSALKANYAIAILGFRCAEDA
jgi:formylglycine-generating enzyme required for sulfatase activity